MMLYNADCFDVMKEMADGSADMVLSLIHI